MNLPAIATGDVSPYTADAVLRQVALIQEIATKVMKDGEHFGVIPGCGDKPALLKAGAEKLLFTFRLRAELEVQQADFENGHREYRITAIIKAADGTVVGHGVGICSTLEAKYRWRKTERICPECGKATIIKGKKEYGGGWLCFAKKGGCNAKWPDGAEEIEAQVAGRTENPDIADTYNTVLKMAKKRALVDGAITACAASDFFTQDIEELQGQIDEGQRQQQAKADGQAHAEQSAAARPTAAAAATPAVANGTPATSPAQPKPTATTTATADRVITKQEVEEVYFAVFGPEGSIGSQYEEIGRVLWESVKAPQTMADRLALLQQVRDDVAEVVKRLGAAGTKMVRELCAEPLYGAGNRPTREQARKWAEALHEMVTSGVVPATADDDRAPV